MIWNVSIALQCVQAPRAFFRSVRSNSVAVMGQPRFLFQIYALDSLLLPVNNTKVRVHLDQGRRSMLSVRQEI